ncbi:hypothetical protein Hypma_001184 [Hypsizygus marmoreus]|uniref:MYND-type domain-containing protein n=1 Tax=Hypsizygus marmoreus TaxID=39966 RepID=A0A369J8V7_HYPMA|nr:hypothetical protein Hypma_001184 [Hypsizygus marmoreus]
MWYNDYNAYCSVACQELHWTTTHRLICTEKPITIDVERLNPLLALLVEYCHLDPAKPLHPALTRTIINSPNPSPSADVLPHGSGKARLVILGDSIPTGVERQTKLWWPSGVSNLARIFLDNQRYECRLPVNGLGGLKPPMRLKYKSFPIADFGIAKGKIAAKDHHKLAYQLDAQGTVLEEQDPDNHYWLYFTTTKEEQLLMDYGLLTFDHMAIVDTKAYQHPALPSKNKAPAYFCDRTMAGASPPIHDFQQRFSFFWDDGLRSLIAHCLESLDEPVGAHAIWSLLDRLARRQCSAAEKVLAVHWARLDRAILETIFNDPTKPWEKWPPTPRIGVWGQSSTRSPVE